MNRHFLELYEDELRHIREVAGEFAADHEEVARRLTLNRDGGSTCADPFVERLLEGFAFLTARVRQKLEAEYPRFTQGILDTVYPDYLAPWPSAAIVRITPKSFDSIPPAGTPAPRHTLLESRRIGDTPCTFRTAHPLTLYPLSISEAKYHVADVHTLKLPTGSEPAAAFRIRLKLEGTSIREFKDLACGHLDFYLHAPRDPRLPSDLLENLFAGNSGILVTAPGDAGGSTQTWLGKEHLQHAGFEEEEALLPVSTRSFEGHRILREHFLLPARNHFFKVTGLLDAFKSITAGEVDLIFVLDRVKQQPGQPLPGDFVQLNCTPAINLFPMSANRVPVNHRASEYQVIVNRHRTLDYEIYRVEKVTGYRPSSQESAPFYPFYLQPVHREKAGGYYTVFRAMRRPSASPGSVAARQQAYTSKDDYPGSEIFLSLTSDTGKPLLPLMEELQVQALCTNRHLPIDLAADTAGFVAKGVAHATSVQVLTGPTSPRPSFVEGREAWRAISHLSLNYLSLVENAGPAGRQGVDALRTLLKLHSADAGDTPANASIERVRSIASKSDLARSPEGGPVAFIRGVNIDLVLDDSGHVGSGIFPLASVLEQFFARHVSINHFTRLTLHTRERKDVVQWPARVGRIPVC